MSWCPWELEALDPLELQIITVPHGYWESNHGILEESYVLVSAESSPAHFLVLGMELKALCTIGTNYNSSELKTTSTSHGAGPLHKNKRINYDKIENMKI